MSSMTISDIRYIIFFLYLFWIVGDTIGSFAPSNNERPRTEWTAAMDQYFIELMLDQIVKGNKAGNTFNKQAWTDMLASFNAKFGPQHGKRVLRHRYKKLLKYYSEMKVLHKQNGFTWDETQHMFVADNDVWDSYIKVKGLQNCNSCFSFLFLSFSSRNISHFLCRNIHKHEHIEWRPFQITMIWSLYLVMQLKKEATLIYINNKSMKLKILE